MKNSLVTHAGFMDKSFNEVGYQVTHCFLEFYIHDAHWEFDLQINQCRPLGGQAVTEDVNYKMTLFWHIGSSQISILSKRKISGHYGSIINEHFPMEVHGEIFFKLCHGKSEQCLMTAFTTAVAAGEFALLQSQCPRVFTAPLQVAKLCK